MTHLFLVITIASAFFAAYKESYIGLMMFVISCATTLILRAQENQNQTLEPTKTMEYMEAVDQFRMIVDQNLANLKERTTKLENEMSKIALGAAFKKK